MTTNKNRNLLKTLSPIEFHLPTVSSTNDYAKELLGTYPYVFVSALHQTAGRGRKGRIWHGDFGANVYCSIGIKHKLSPLSDDLSIYMAKGSMAALKVVRAALPDSTIMLKYPNDVVLKREGVLYKVAGTLIEHEFHGSNCESTVVGIGINVDQVEFPDTIAQPCTSLRLAGAKVNLRDTIEQVKNAFSEYHATSTSDLFSEWIIELDIVGRRVKILSENGVWTVKQVMDDGRLLVCSEVSKIERTISDADTIRYED